MNILVNETGTHKFVDPLPSNWGEILYTEISTDNNGNSNTDTLNPTVLPSLPSWLVFLSISFIAVGLGVFSAWIYEQLNLRKT